MKPEDFKAVISSAIDGEIEAYNYYRDISEKVQDPALQRIFSELAGDESGHREFLQAMLDQGPKALRIDESQDYKIADTLELPPLTSDMKPTEGMVLAIRKELDAMQRYTQLARVSSDPGEKHTFLELAKMEKNHKTRLEDLYTNMAFPEVW
jgi:rubrerythrin